MEGFSRCYQDAVAKNFLKGVKVMEQDKRKTVVDWLTKPITTPAWMRKAGRVFAFLVALILTYSILKEAWERGYIISLLAWSAATSYNIAAYILFPPLQILLWIIIIYLALILRRLRPTTR